MAKLAREPLDDRVGFPEGAPVGDRIRRHQLAPGCGMSVMSAGLSLPHAANAWGQ